MLGVTLQTSDISGLHIVSGFFTSNVPNNQYGLVWGLARGVITAASGIAADLRMRAKLNGISNETVGAKKKPERILTKWCCRTTNVTCYTLLAKILLHYTLSIFLHFFLLLSHLLYISCSYSIVHIG